MTAETAGPRTPKPRCPNCDAKPLRLVCFDCEQEIGELVVSDQRREAVTLALTELRREVEGLEPRWTRGDYRDVSYELTKRVLALIDKAG